MFLAGNLQMWRALEEERMATKSLPQKTVLKAVVISRQTFQCISRAESGAPGKLLDVTLSSGFLVFRMEII